MNMTHYMELLAVNQPWNLIIFMAVPIGFGRNLSYHGVLLTVYS